MNTIANYDAVAHEYYDPDAHPTCDNFRQLSRKFIGAHLHLSKTVLEIGAGRSVVAEILEEHGRSLLGLTVQDKSREMLEYSSHWFPFLSNHFISDAHKTPCRDSFFDTIVSSLGDPYNNLETMTEVHRILASGGRYLITLPDHEWAVSFRNDEQTKYAEFLTRSGEKLLVPSLTMAFDEQVELANEAGLSLDLHQRLTLDGVRGRISPKLSRDKYVLECFVFRKHRS
ncbi:class I SAM-dependent methyltransferase [Sphingomonas sp. KRR8]|uniref:class I SAM-dependent methyltransferase n=1 Tax=Sphingomonas sp. KRR8 TaxID=2942996 RepID=UPI0020215C9C|nr:methyltransferase domain-containing protein [Sphingomonas sp. KRR8]URD62169.1 class I SAM-dependent methyltransferase [Sphingomonas sp. KRR8]